MKHDDIRHKLFEYIDGAVADKEKAEIEEHLKTCSKCSNALAELRKTIEHINSLEEAESPAWMTQKIMAKVREEAKSRKSIWQKIFYPLHVKLPIEAVAVAFLAITAFYIYEAGQPMMKTAETPAERFAAKQEVPAPVTPEKEEPSSVIAKDEVLKQSQKLKAEAPVPAPAAEPMSEKGLEAKRERFAEEPKVAKGEESIALSQKQKRAAPSVGFTALGEARREAPAPEASALVDKKEEGISLTVRVKDIEAAAQEVEKAVARVGGKAIRTESTTNKKILVARINTDKLQDLIAKLKLVGEVEDKEKAGAVKEKEGPSSTQESGIETRTEVIKISIQK